ncbi:MAG: dTDP-4-dehydrorhamnose reductase [Saprospiraceae bacterium]|nr:dTDP-4-dehydrorhamnose reductase [Saprospiraceae bacterium]
MQLQTSNLKPQTILVTGATGQIGQELQVLASQFPDFHFHFVSRNELDISDKTLIDNLFNLQKFDYCINCAAYTAVDKAESEPELAYQINVKSVINLVEACNKTGATFIHFSTDYVYHNLNCTPLTESDPTFPQSVYAQTKLDGEQAALAICEHTMIIRTSWVYSSFGHNFVKTMLRLGKERPELGVVYDQIGTPTYARDLAKTILNIIQKVESGEINRSLLHDLYNYSNEGVTSWYDFAKAIFEMSDMNCKVIPIETKDYPTPATRPPYSVLNKSRIKNAFGIEIPHWRESLQACLAALKL